MKKFLLAGAAAVLVLQQDRDDGPAAGLGHRLRRSMDRPCWNEGSERREHYHRGIDHFFVFGDTKASVMYSNAAEAGEQAIGTKVTKAADSWTYSPVRYWVEDKTYDFAAYSPDLTDVATVAADAANKRSRSRISYRTRTIQHDLISLTYRMRRTNKRYSSPSAMRFP